MYTLQKGSLEPHVRKRLEAFTKDNFSRRLWDKDGSLWVTDPQTQEGIKKTMGWLDVANRMKEEIAGIQAFASKVVEDGIKDVVLLGMGGSSLCPEVFRQTFGSASGFPTLHVLDSTDPGAVIDVEKRIHLKKTLFVVASKSGTTTEVLSFYEYFHAKQPDGSHFVAITDPGTPLEEMAKTNGFRQVFLNPPDIGGRYSALSFFGMVPAALIGMDLERLLSGAQDMMRACGAETKLAENPGISLGVLLGEASKEGRDKLTFMVSPKIASLGLWLEQLIAESTGKEGKGVIPVAGEPLAREELYGSDRLFAWIKLEGEEDSKQAALMSQLQRDGHPVVEIELSDLYDLGSEFYRWEIATATAGAVLKINPFDQPNVQEAKTMTKEILSEYERSGKLPEESSGASLEDLLPRIKGGDYVAWLAYIPYDPTYDKIVSSLRAVVLEKYKVATTFGYGPRFLHSTGQLHKGGPASGLFVQITSEKTEDRDVPGQNYSFQTLQAAQAAGDLKALQARQRRVIRIHLEGDVLKGLQELERKITAWN